MKGEILCDASIIKNLPFAKEGPEIALNSSYYKMLTIKNSAFSERI